MIRMEVASSKRMYYAIEQNIGSGMIVKSWKECRALLWHIAGTKYQAFDSYQEAMKYLKMRNVKIIDMDKPSVV